MTDTPRWLPAPDAARVALYTASVDQERLATAAIVRLQTGGKK